jgi:hypothetical protein
MLSGHGEPLKSHASTRVSEFIDQIKNNEATK